MGGILKERFVWNVDFVEGGVVNFKEQGFKDFLVRYCFFLSCLSRGVCYKVFRRSKYRVVWRYLSSILPPPPPPRICPSHQPPDWLLSVYIRKGVSFEESVVLCLWGSETRKFGLSTELIM